VLGGHGNHFFIALRPDHDGVDQGRHLALGQRRGDGIDIGGIQRQRNVIDHFLNHFHHPRHQLMAFLLGRSEIDVDDVHPFFLLEKGFFLNRFGVSLLEGFPDFGSDDVQTFSDHPELIFLDRS
jgi:hypothetical protein